VEWAIGDDAIMARAGDENEERCVPWTVQSPVSADEQNHSFGKTVT
jgi:hypothetical protein